MENKRLLLIVNPISGTRPKDELVPLLEDKLLRHGYEVDMRYTACRGDATGLASEAVVSGYAGVVVCGGDGTVNETARALCDTGMPMAIIPSGSGNGLARHLGLSADELSAVDIIIEDNIRDCDYGEANGVKFFCTFGMGFDAAVAEKFATQPKRGLATYVKNAVQVFTKYSPKEYTLTIDGHTAFDTKAYLVACCNASQYGNNVFVAPEASITDGVFDVIILKDAPHIQTLLAGLDMLTGMLPYNHQIEIIKAREVDISCHEDCPAHIDGEPLRYGAGETIHIDMHHGGIRLYSNPGKKKFTPFITPLDNLAKDVSAAVSKIL